MALRFLCSCFLNILRNVFQLTPQKLTEGVERVRADGLIFSKPVKLPGTEAVFMDQFVL